MEDTPYSLVSDIKQLNLIFRRTCRQVVLLNNYLTDTKIRFERACADNRRSFRYHNRLKMSSIEGALTMFYEYACSVCDDIEDKQYKLSEMTGEPTDDLYASFTDEEDPDSYWDTYEDRYPQQETHQEGSQYTDNPALDGISRPANPTPDGTSRLDISTPEGSRGRQTPTDVTSGHHTPSPDVPPSISDPLLVVHDSQEHHPSTTPTPSSILHPSQTSVTPHTADPSNSPPSDSQLYKSMHQLHDGNVYYVYHFSDSSDDEEISPESSFHWSTNTDTEEDSPEWTTNTEDPSLWSLSSTSSHPSSDQHLRYQGNSPAYSSSSSDSSLNDFNYEDYEADEDNYNDEDTDDDTQWALLHYNSFPVVSPP